MSDSGVCDNPEGLEGWDSPGIYLNRLRLIKARPISCDRDLPIKACDERRGCRRYLVSVQGPEV